MNFCKSKKIYIIITILIFLIGFFLRTRAYSLALPFWIDETALYLNLIDKPIEHLFGSLENGQMAPVLFLLSSKVLVESFKNSELAARFIPFIFSIINLFLFYFLAKKIYKKRISILFSLSLFAINFPLIYYSQMLKHYQTDVFVCMTILVAALFFDFNKINIKKCILFTITSFVLATLSNISIFVFGAVFLAEFIFSKTSSRRKNIFTFFCLFFIPFTLYYFLYLRSDTNMPFMTHNWQNDFLNFDIKNIIRIAQENTNYFFKHIDFLFLLPLYMLSAFVIFKERNKSAIILVFTIILTMLASLLSIYPYSQRLLLFLTPVFIILLAYPLELIEFSGENKSTKWKISFFLALYYILTFTPYSLKMLKYDLNKNNYLKTNWPHYLSLISNDSRKDDLIFIDSVLWDSYKFYRKKSNAKISHYDTIFNPYDKKGSKEQIDKMIQQSKKRNIWLILHEQEGQQNIFDKLNKNDIDFSCEKINSITLCSILLFKKVMVQQSNEVKKENNPF